MERIEKLILEQAERSPGADAVEHNGARLTYSEMSRRARRVSAALRESGLVPGAAVMVCQERSLATIPLLLGIWEAGGVVVPVNPNAPAKMLEWIIEDSSPHIIVTDADIEPRIAAAAAATAKAPVVMTAAPGLGDGGSTPTPSAAFARSEAGGGDVDEDVCYIIYTSGSEGRPKGVVGSHRSLAHYLRWQAGEFANTGADRFSQIAPLSFDFSLKELLVPLICGACVCIADRNTVVLDPEKFIKWVGESGITVMCCVPTLARSILQLPESPGDKAALRTVRQLLISGDMLRWDDVDKWRRRFGAGMSLFNLYGPTESTVIKLFYPIPEARNPESVNVPVGRPIEGAEVLILDDDGRPCAPLQTGEIVILSDWLARGYVNGGAGGAKAREHAFCVIEHDGKPKRAYRTGDMGRLLGTGDIELVGRKDRQVKIRGHRIELNEIESVLSEHAGVRDVAVLMAAPPEAAGGDEEALIACYFATHGPDVTEKEISAFAKERLLPQVFSLTRFTRLEELPLTTNGKVDRLRLKALAEQNGAGAAASANGSPAQAAEAGPAAPATVRQRISKMWGELLSLDHIAPEANFFQLGGDSLTAIRLLRRLREEVHPAVKLGDVYDCPSVSQLSERVELLFAQAQ